MTRPLRIGTRGSRLALAQAGMVVSSLERSGYDCQQVVIETDGDRDTDRAFAEIGEFGVFVRQIELALVEERIDLAVHSCKDLPTRGPEGLVLAALLERADPRDVLVTLAGEGGVGRPVCASGRVGTSSARRRALLAEWRPDLEPVLLRGNVPTRLAKLARGDCDAILLARAGIDRLLAAEGGGLLDGLATMALDPTQFVPAPGQGAIALQARAGDDVALAAAAAFDHPATRRCVTAERELLARLEGGCDLALGAWCRQVDDGELELTAALGLGDRVLRASAWGVAAASVAGAVFAGLQLEAQP